MRIEKLACPSCGAPLSGDFLPNQQFECGKCGSVLLLTDLETSHTIICPDCRAPNHEEMRFCSNCGGTLKIDCVLCHTENRIDVTHCAHCGANLERARAKREEMLDIRQRLLEERAQVLREKETRQNQEKLERLIAELDEPEKHEFAIFQLQTMGDVAIDALTETLLTDTDPDARYGSAIALGRICADHNLKALDRAKAAKSLVKALTDNEPAVRFWSAEALGKFKNKIALEPLAALLKDRHKGVRQQAQASLDRLRK
jgi:DNA-directed RNA polymerase subunit M/transcription elongation factor TFIIS